MVAESSLSTGTPIIYRSPEERAANPDRLNLDRSPTDDNYVGSVISLHVSVVTSPGSYCITGGG